MGKIATVLFLQLGFVYEFRVRIDDGGSRQCRMITNRLC